MKIIYFSFFFISLFLIFNGKVLPQKVKPNPKKRIEIILPSKSIFQKTEEKCSYSEKPIDTQTERLPINYFGNDLEGIIEEIKRRGKLVKDEFETTIQFKERVEKESQRNLKGELSYKSIFAFVSNGIDFRYDADKQIMSGFWSEDRVISWFTPCTHSSSEYKLFSEIGLRELSSSVNFEIDIEKAKKTKPNLRMLIIGSLTTPPSVEEDYPTKRLEFEIKDIWFYDIQTGEVFIKLNISEYKKQKASLQDILKSEINTLLGEANNFFEEQKDDKAMQILRKIIYSEPINGNAHLLVGKIRGYQGNCVNQKSA